MPEAEIAKRQDAFTARKTLLKSNPSLYISKTRLSIRQLPLFVTDRTLKRLAIHAIRTFDQEVEASTREPLNRQEENDDTISPAVVARDGKKKRGERETAVIQSKVVRQSEKTDPITGQGKSKGYAFLEMRTHKDALKVLRYANNNPEVGKLVLEWYKIELGEMLEKAKKDLKAKRENKSKVVEAVAVDSDKEEEAKPIESKPKGPEVTEEDLEARVRKIESGLQERQDGMRGGKTLLLEFSIENVQVVKRRGEKMTAVRDGTDAYSSNKRKDRDDETETKTGSGSGSGAGSKKPKADPGAGEHEKSTKRGKERRDRSKGKALRDEAAKSAPAASSDAKTDAPVEKRGIEKDGQNIGSLIGRKRRRKAGK